MYVRDEKLQQCWEQNAWYGMPDDSEITETFLYNPDDTAMETLAALKPEWFVYDQPFLLSPDRTILYGFSVIKNEEVLEIPKDVRIYDNLFLHEEDEGYHRILLNEKLDEIVNTQNCFGYYVKDYKICGTNEDFYEVDGVLYDGGQTDLILFPSGRRANDPGGFSILTMELQKIRSYAFCMNGFIKALVIPPGVEFEKNAFYIQNGTGKIFTEGYNRPYFETCEDKGIVYGVEVGYFLAQDDIERVIWERF